MRTIVLLIVMTVLGGVGAVYSLAGHTPGATPSYTGCLNTSAGTINDLVAGDAPADACGDKEVQIHLGGGDVTSVAAGPGLTGGGSVGDVTLNVDPAEVQTRISGNCLSAGEAIQGVHQDGSVLCTVGPRAFAHFADVGGDVSNQGAAVGSLALPPGNWIVFAKVVLKLQFPLTSEEVWETTCTLSAPNGLDQAATGGDTDFEGSGTLTMMAPAVSGAPQTATVECRDTGDNPVFGDADWERLSIVAIKLSDLIVN